ncbi:hypothetical protein [Azospirillum sp. B2RO_4]|uniref:hypothetical protein n=1 Tax=Azospirillum sp. B2RO_4 TaxID=3027796 RepID=UPI003DA8382B
MWHIRIIAVLTSMIPFGVHAAGDMLRTNDVIWKALSEAEKDRLRSSYVVDVANGRQYGTIIDAQAVDESTPGTNVGAAIGQAYGSAMYIDNAFKRPNPNYSATNHVGAALLGAILGSALDAPAVRQFRFRYTVRSLDGSTTQIDRVEAQPFRQPLGVCVSVPALTIEPQGTCETSAAEFRVRYFSQEATVSPPGKVVKKTAVRPSTSKAVEANQIVKCRLGETSIVYVEYQSCLNAEGKVL